MADEKTNGQGGDTADTPAKRPARKTRAQTAREAAAKANADGEARILASAESFQVLYPTGLSLWVDAEPEVSYDMGTETVWADAENEHVTIPYGARIRASNLKQLDQFRALAAQSMLAASYAQVGEQSE